MPRTSDGDGDNQLYCGNNDVGIHQHVYLIPLPNQDKLNLDLDKPG
jgi:hypothetical protein